MKRRNASGFQFILLAVLVPALAVLSAAILLSRARASTAMVSKAATSLQARDLVNSILAETTHEFMLSVNDPAKPVFTQLRRALRETPRDFIPRLPYSRNLLASQGSFRLESALAKITQIQPRLRSRKVPVWTGVAQFEVRLIGVGTNPSTWTGFESREIIVDYAGVPAELDHTLVRDLVWFDLPSRMVMHQGVPIYLPFDKSQPKSVPMAPADLISRATLRIESTPDSSVQSGYEFLRERLGVLNGVIVVGDENSRPLTLSGLRHRGKTVLVIMGPVSLNDIHLDDPERDCLTIVAFGALHLAGDVEARIIVSDPVKRDPAAAAAVDRTVAAGTHLTGSLFVLSGKVQYGKGFTVDPPRKGLGFAVPMYVSVSPTLLDSNVEVR